jgi:8-oxo-dGTP pyrophosphatase MutT (NUDIX family)
MSEEVSKNIFEETGFLLSYKSYFVLGARIKKAGDLDPIKEVEYMGGKPEGTETPYETAYNELVEECGGDPLNPDWKTRCKELHTFQPFSKKWIWCLQLELNDGEFDRLVTLDTRLDAWPVEELRDFSALTTRAAPARKALKALLLADQAEVVKYLENFCSFPASGNRMKDAKTYGSNKAILFECYRLSCPAATYQRRLRGFNLVIFETHQEFLTGKGKGR